MNRSSPVVYKLKCSILAHRGTRHSFQALFLIRSAHNPLFWLDFPREWNRWEKKLLFLSSFWHWPVVCKIQLSREDTAAWMKIVKRAVCSPPPPAAVKSFKGLNRFFIWDQNPRKSVLRSLVTVEVWSLIQMLIQIIRAVDFHLACCKAGLHEGVCVCEVNG